MGYPNPRVWGCPDPRIWQHHNPRVQGQYHLIWGCRVLISWHGSVPIFGCSNVPIPWNGGALILGCKNVPISHDGDVPLLGCRVAPNPWDEWVLILGCRGVSGYPSSIPGFQREFGVTPGRHSISVPAPGPPCTPIPDPCLSGNEGVARN